MKKPKKRYLKRQEFASVSDRWKHIISFLIENKKNITSKGLNNEAVFQLGRETIVIKGKK